MEQTFLSVLGEWCGNNTFHCCLWNHNVEMMDELFLQLSCAFSRSHLCVATFFLSHKSEKPLQDKLHTPAMER